MKSLEQNVLSARAEGRTLALMFIDLDRFKWINDNLGHAAGDVLLQESANRILDCFQKDDVVARLGGDEFIALMVDDVSHDNAARAARQVLDQLNTAFVLEGESVHISGSLGIALLPGDADNKDDLLKLADEAMYKSKNAGRNAYHFHTGESFIQPKRY